MKRALFLMLLLLSTACDSLPPLAFSEGAVNEALGDQDGDGFVACPSGLSSTEQAQAGCDCDDSSPAIHPHIQELCDSIDNDCSGSPDDGPGYYAQWRDTDGDGWGNPGLERWCDQPLAEYAPLSDDCNDAAKSIHPYAREFCDSIDNDCDAAVDESAEFLPYFRDADNDGYGTSEETVEDCKPPLGFSALSGDCLDDNSDVHPYTLETCENGLDDNCDGYLDCPTDPLEPAQSDPDGDGAGYQIDCDSSDNGVYPGSLELCDEKDNDCDGTVDNASEQTWYLDEDEDGWGSDSIELLLRECDLVGLTTQSGDCDDGNAITFPRSVEVCDGFDNDCDGVVPIEEQDEDGDGYPLCSSQTVQGDCDDTDASLNPATEWVIDLDADGFGDAEQTEVLIQCEQPDGFVLDSSDCNDSDTMIFPEAFENCDGLDSDCNGEIPSDELDLDFDGYWNCNGDCDDTRAEISPGSVELCDFLDNDCDGAIDETSIEYPGNGLDDDCDGREAKLVQVDGGYSHSIASDDFGRVWAWGENSNGQLGDGTEEQRLLPTMVAGLPDIALNPANEVRAGMDFSLALMTDGTLRSWGGNGGGQLGNGTQIDSQLPVSVEGLPDPARTPVIRLATGDLHSLALLRDGSVWAWGQFIKGNLGGSGTPGVPLRVLGLPDVTTNPAIGVAAGSMHSLALLKDGSVRAWGDNSSGQLGNDSVTTYTSSPVLVMGLPDPAINPVTAVFAGGGLSFAILQDGSVRAWGAPFGPPSVINGLPDPALNPVVSVAASGHFLALLEDGSVATMGSNTAGELGIGTCDSQLSAAVVIESLNPAENSVISIGVGYEYSLAVDERGIAFAWGANYFGQLGDGSTSHKPPAPVTGLPETYGVPVALAAGLRHSLAQMLDGSVMAWGGNSSGQLGDASGTMARSSPFLVQGLPDASVNPVTRVAAGAYHSLSLLDDGSVLAWGHFGNGQLGRGTSWDDYAVPEPVIGLPDPYINPAVAIAAGAYSSLALLSDGTIFAWGGPYLGNGVGGQSNVPIQVQGLPNPSLIPATSISAYGESSFAVLKNGYVMAWGDNSQGQLGDGTTQDAYYPVPVEGLPEPSVKPIQSITPGNLASFALFLDGSLLAWGRACEAIGGSESQYLLSPTHVPGLPDSTLNPVISVASGTNQTLALLEDGSVFEWGYDDKLFTCFPPRLITQLPDSSVRKAIGLSTGGYHSLALLDDGSLYSWRLNDVGQLGRGDTWTPQPVLWGP